MSKSIILIISLLGEFLARFEGNMYGYPLAFGSRIREPGPAAAAREKGSADQTALEQSRNVSRLPTEIQNPRFEIRAGRDTSFQQKQSHQVVENKEQRPIIGQNKANFVHLRVEEIRNQGGC
jgi:hypothetical protein